MITCCRYLYIAFQLGDATFSIESGGPNGGLYYQNIYTLCDQILIQEMEQQLSLMVNTWWLVFFKFFHGFGET